MIRLTETLNYNTTLQFVEQAQDVQDFINAQMQAESERTTNSYCGRTESETWNKTTYEITRTYNYLAPETAANCFALGTIIINVNTL